MIATTIAVTTSELRNGDTIVSVGSRKTLMYNGATVDSVQKRAKRATITFTDERRTDDNVDATWQVTRMVQTEEEKAAERDEFLEKALRSRMASAKADLEKAREKMVARMVDGNLADHWDFTRLAEAQASWDLWARVEMVEGRQADDKEPKTFLEIVEMVRERCREDLLSFRAESRSTSTMANAVEDVQLSAKREFISRWI